MQKQEKIVDMFNQIAPTYDVANRVLSLGVDVSWRKFACRYMLEIFKNKSINIVDVACGTGDMMGLWSEIFWRFAFRKRRADRCFQTRLFRAKQRRLRACNDA